MEGNFDSEYEDLIALDIHRRIGMIAWIDGMPLGIADLSNDTRDPPRPHSVVGQLHDRRASAWAAT